MVGVEVGEEPGGGGHPAGGAPKLVNHHPHPRQQLPLRQPSAAPCPAARTCITTSSAVRRTPEPLTLHYGAQNTHRSDQNVSVTAWLSLIETTGLERGNAFPVLCENLQLQIDINARGGRNANVHLLLRPLL